jgi:hypothetical protein
MIELLVSLLVFLLILGLVWYVIQMLPLPEPFGRIAQVVLVVVAIIFLIYFLMGALGSGPSFSLRR